MTTSPTHRRRLRRIRRRPRRARRAVDRVAGGKVFVVHAYDAPADYWGGEHYQEMLDRALERGEHLLDTLLEPSPGSPTSNTRPS